MAISKITKNTIMLLCIMFDVLSSAVDKFTIWKHVTRKNPETGEETGKMILKAAAFFSRSQVEAIAYRDWTDQPHK